MRSRMLRLAARAARVLPDSALRALYRLGPLSRALRRTLNRAAPLGTTEITVAAGALEGMRLKLDLQAEKDHWLGTYEPEVQATLLRWVRPGQVVYDLGANLGYLTLLVAREVGAAGRVFAFEPVPANLERLREHLAINDLASRVEVVAGAVAARSGPIRFLTGPSPGTGRTRGSYGRQFVDTESFTTTGIALDDFVYARGQPTPDLVKMDIEGGEGPALAGMERVLREARPIVLVEIHGPESARAVWNALTGTGYRLHHITESYPAVESPDSLPWKSYLISLPEGVEPHSRDEA